MKTYISRTRYMNYDKWETSRDKPFNYANGFIHLITSPTIYKTTNPVLRSVIMIYEQTFINLMKYIDELKHFKNIHHNNW